jgi:hypothetical protein
MSCEEEREDKEELRMKKACDSDNRGPSRVKLRSSAIWANNCRRTHMPNRCLGNLRLVWTGWPHKELSHNSLPRGVRER